MRLLRASGDDDFTLVEFVGRTPPKYAILSHTWGADEDEVTFKDISKGKGKGKTKPGYAKLQFCAAQAAKDKLEFFWVDTCCIDKSSSAELAEAINSMFKWYRNSRACYVYLSDVPSTSKTTVQSDKQPSFRNNRWFTRGWTLQELLAPETVVFFSTDGTRIGDKASLATEIALETTIPVAALENGPRFMLKYPVEERMNWAKHRRTKREEDAAYCLLGIFEVQMPLIYGEGKTKAFGRLEKEIESIYGRHDWIDNISRLYGLPLLRIPWAYIGYGVAETVKIMILVFTVILIIFMVTYDLPLTIWFLGYAVAATPFYLCGCTRWNRAEGILIFSLVVGICYVAGKLICLQMELRRLNDIVFDNAMMHDVDRQTIHVREIMRRISKGAT